MTDKQIIIDGVEIDGVDVSRCKHYKHNDKNSGWSSCTSKDEEHIHAVNPLCCEKKDCLYKQLKRSEVQCEVMFVLHTDLEKRYKAKEQELIDYKKQFKADTKEMEDYQNEIARHLQSIEYWQHQAELGAETTTRLTKELQAKEQEYEELRKYHNKCCEEFEKEKKEWLEKYNQNSRGFYNGDYCNTEHCSLLKAKEQECEELKAMQKDLSFENQKFCYQIEEQTKQLEPFKDEYFKGLDNVVIAELAKKSIRITAVNSKLEQTLTEIKEIAESEIDSKEFMAIQCMLNGSVDNKNKVLKQILQKISEGEV